MGETKIMIQYRIQRHSRSTLHGRWLDAGKGLTWDLIHYDNDNSAFWHVYKIDNVIYKYKSKALKLAVEKHLIWEKLSA